MGEIQPHLVRYWLHSSEKTDSPETFEEKVNEICAVYQEAAQVHEAGGHTVSVDEMTGIQALERKYPDRPVMPGKAARMEFEYIRHGTTSLIGFFDIATGRVQAPYLNQTRTEEDFANAIKALVATDPEASWTFVCDGLNIHKSESLVRYWLHSSEKTDSPETFEEKVNEICAVYQEAEQVHEAGGHTVSVDEMTGIQALERKYPDRPVMPGKAARMEFEYIRHGTTSLIGFFDIATGRVEAPYLCAGCSTWTSTRSRLLGGCGSIRI